MTKILNVFRQKLSFQLIFVVTFALIIAYISFPLLTRTTYFLLDRTIGSHESLMQLEEQYIWLLQEYVTDNNITLDDISLLNHWVKGEKNINLTLFSTNLLFDSDYESRVYNDANETNGEENLQVYYNQYLDKQYISSLIKEYNSNFYTLTFADGTAVNALVHCYGYSQYYVWGYNACLFLALAIFLVISCVLVQRKLRYIHLLSKELNILEGGDLDYEITELGRDELNELAKGINQMRLSIINKKLEEEKSKEANQKLVTALAHDLRTPLTSLIGYLELMLLKRYRDEDQLKHFLLTTKRKAFQIREMSDKLFEYFLVSEQTEATYHKEVISTHDLITGLIDNQLFDLENSGFLVKLYAVEDSFKGSCYIDAEYLQRVLDNTLSNIRKYADKTGVLDVLAFETDAFLHIEFVNSLNHDLYNGESTSLGLQTCLKIMQEHGGSYQGYESDDKFVSRLILPLYTANP